MLGRRFPARANATTGVKNKVSTSTHAFLGFPVFTHSVTSEYECSFWVDPIQPSFQSPTYDFDLNMGPNNPKCSPNDLQCESPYPGACMSRTTVGDWKHGRYAGALYACLDHAKRIDMFKAWTPDQWGYDPVEMMTVLEYDSAKPGKRYCGYLVEKVASATGGKQVVRVFRNGTKDAPSPKNRTIVEVDQDQIFVPPATGHIASCLTGSPPPGCDRMFICDDQPTLLLYSNSGGGKAPVYMGR